MAEKTLVESQVVESQHLLKALDNSGLKPELVVWYYYDDIDDWRLILCGFNIDGYLPAKEALAYKDVAEQLTQLDSKIAVSDIKFLSTKAPLISALRFLIATGPFDISSIYISNTTINGIFLKDVVVLRSSLKG